MEDYYSLLQQGVGRGEALRQVQRQLRNIPGYRHPYLGRLAALGGFGGAARHGSRPMSHGAQPWISPGC